MLFTDTDSLVHENKNLFDFSDDLKYSTFCDLVNKKVICKMKDKVKEKIISKFVGLGSKMYSLVIVNNEEIKKGKGANKNVVKNLRQYLSV